MTTAAKTAFGAQLWIGPVGGTLVKVAELISVGFPRQTRELIDATTHDSPLGAKQMIPSGIFDPGDFPFKVNYIANNPGDLMFRAAIADAAEHDLKIVVKGATTTVEAHLSGYVTEYGPDDLPVDGLQTASGTIKATSALTFA